MFLACRPTSWRAGRQLADSQMVGKTLKFQLLKVDVWASVFLHRNESRNMLEILYKACSKHWSDILTMIVSEHCAEQAFNVLSLMSIEFNNSNVPSLCFVGKSRQVKRLLLLLSPSLQDLIALSCRGSFSGLPCEPTYSQTFSLCRAFSNALRFPPFSVISTKKK